MQKTLIRPFLDTRTSVILWANWFQFAAGERAFNPRVMSRMLLWCQKGTGRVRVNGTWHAMQPDDFLFLPWQHEVLYLADDREPFGVGAIHLIPAHATNRKLVFSVSHHARDTWAKCPWRRDRKWPGLEAVRVGVAKEQDPLRLLASYIVERFEEGAMPEAALRMLSQVLVQEIARTLTQKAVARVGNDVVRRTQEFIESHWDQNISLRDLARLTHCSVSTLRRQFQQTLGMPPYEWILQGRIRQARRLLITTTLQIQRSRPAGGLRRSLPVLAHLYPT